MDNQDYDRQAAKYLMSDDLTPQKSVGLLLAAADSGDEEIYEEAKSDVSDYLDTTRKELTARPMLDGVKLSDARELLREGREVLVSAVESSYGMDEDNKNLVDETQQASLYNIRDILVHDGQKVF